MVAPVPDEENGSARADAPRGADSSGYVAYGRLVQTLALVAFVLFAWGSASRRFRANPISG
jgi:hypothetical protein